MVGNVNLRNVSAEKVIEWLRQLAVVLEQFLITYKEEQRRNIDRSSH